MENYGVMFWITFKETKIPNLWMVFYTAKYKAVYDYWSTVRVLVMFL